MRREDLCALSRVAEPEGEGRTTRRPLANPMCRVCVCDPEVQFTGSGLCKSLPAFLEGVALTNTCLASSVVR